MGSVIYDKSTSLDGFIAGANVRLEAGPATTGSGSTTGPSRTKPARSSWRARSPGSAR
jgi:hypothetical protein